MKKRCFLLFLAAAVCITLAACGNGQKIRFGTGNNGGTYFQYGSLMAQMLSDEGIAKPEVKETAGSAANLRLINEGFLQLTITQSDVLSDASSGSGIFEGKDYSGGYGAIGALYTEACQIIVPKESEIKSVADLAGLRVSIGEKESGVAKNAEEILSAYGLSTKMIQPEYLSFQDSANALKEGRIDAFFCTAGAPTASVSELAKGNGIRILSIEERIQDNILRQKSGYTTCVIPANTYPGQTEEISTLGVKAVLIASSDMKKETAEEVTRFLLAHRKDLCSSLQIQYEEDQTYLTEDITCGFHEGAVIVYEELGLSLETADARPGSNITGQQDK